MNLSHRVALGAGISLVCLALVTGADAALSKQGDASVKFNASGPGGMNIEGKGSSMWTIDDGKTVKVVVQLTAMTTGMSLRDKHMKEKYLETQKFPDAELVVNRADLKFPAGGATTKAEANGVLKLHGVNKATKFTYSASRDGELYKVSGSLHLSMKDHDIREPSYLGVKVKDGVDVSIQFNVKD
jgi:hypothetical protein